jgi:hypothetical protein
MTGNRLTKSRRFCKHANKTVMRNWRPNLFTFKPNFLADNLTQSSQDSFMTGERGLNHIEFSDS